MHRMTTAKAASVGSSAPPTPRTIHRRTRLAERTEMSDDIARTRCERRIGATLGNARGAGARAGPQAQAEQGRARQRLALIGERTMAQPDLFDGGL